MADSSDIDNAVLQRLGSDSELLSLCPNGVSMDLADEHATRFVLVSIVEARDVDVFNGRAVEHVKYAVKAVMAKKANGDVKRAAARIDELLQDQPLTVTGYQWAATSRDEDDPRIRYTERDDRDATIVWFHRGGNYWVEVARTA